MRFFVKILFLCIPAFGAIFSSITAQEKMEAWHHQSGNSEFPTGVGSAEWYANPSAPKSRKVVVAILDSGIDIGHPDLRDNIWVNPGEIPGNKKDDDGNGYVDDIHGWNFIGGADGRSVVKESYEVTRVYAKEREKWKKIILVTKL